ncbi:MAG TPA: histidine kinase [Pararobbsia sp.]|nr:histidine kinase [Pararobbsia sp.]
MAETSARRWYRSALLRYGGAALLIVSAYEFAGLLAEHFAPAAASMLIISIILISWLGGVGAGFWAAFLAIIVFRYGFITPLYGFAVAPVDVPRLILFSMTAATVGLLGALQNRTAKSLERTHDILQDTIEELTRANQALQSENAEHRRVAAELRISEAMLAEGQKISHTGSWRWNLIRRTLAWSDEHFRIYGQTPDSAGPDVNAVVARVHPDDFIMMRRIVRRAVEAKAAFECEYRIVLDDGRVRYLFGTGRPVQTDDGAIAEFIGTTADITTFVEARQRIRELADRSESAREDERKRLARELHDDLAQSLLALRLQIGVAAYEFGKMSPVFGERVKSMIALVDESIKVLRDAISSLRPVALDMGVLAVLEWLADQWMSDHGLSCQFSSNVQAVPLSEKSTTAVFRIAQEALRNVARHAQASHSSVSLNQSDSHYVLEIRDNGCGFDPSSRSPTSFGLVGIRERASALGGTLEIDSAPGQGTAVRINIPKSMSMAG